MGTRANLLAISNGALEVVVVSNILTFVVFMVFYIPDELLCVAYSFSLCLLQESLTDMIKHTVLELQEE